MQDNFDIQPRQLSISLNFDRFASQHHFENINHILFSLELTNKTHYQFSMSVLQLCRYVH